MKRLLLLLLLFFTLGGCTRNFLDLNKEIIEVIDIKGISVHENSDRILLTGKETLILESLFGESRIQSLGFRNMYPDIPFVYDQDSCLLRETYSENYIINYLQDGISLLSTPSLEKTGYSIYKKYLSSEIDIMDLYTDNMIYCLEEDHMISYFDEKGAIVPSVTKNPRLNIFGENFNTLWKEGKAKYYFLGKKDRDFCNIIWKEAGTPTQKIVFWSENKPNTAYLIKDIFIETSPVCPSVAFDINNSDETSSFETNLKIDN